jgi:hypothetical protein
MQTRTGAQILKIIMNFIVLIILTFINVQLFAQNNIAVVSADTMNILYTWIDNPVSIAVPGIPSDKIKVSINNGTITGTNGKYIVKVDSVAETIIEVSAEIRPGEISKVGSRVFRVKRTPDIKHCIGNYCNDKVNLTIEELLKNPRISVSMKEFLPFDLSFEVLSFKGVVILKEESKSFSLSGNRFSQEFIDYLKLLKPPFKIYIEGIKIKIPDGTTRIMTPMTIRIIENDKK